MMDWRHSIEHLQIDAYVSHMGITVVRTAHNRFLVLQDGFVSYVGGSTTSDGLAIARVMECVTETPQPEPCAKCGRQREVLSYCRECYNAVKLTSNRAYRRRQDSA